MENANQVPSWATTKRQARDPETTKATHHLRVTMPGGGWFVTVPGVPVAKPRHRAAKGVHYVTARQAAAEALITRCAVEQNEGREMVRGAVRLSAVFVFPATATHPVGAHHASKPDVDNLLKLACDGLNAAGCWEDDAKVAIAEGVKLYGSSPVTLLRIEAATGWPGWTDSMVRMRIGQ